MLDYAEAHEEFKPYAFLHLFTYVFLLRLPSEALRALAGGHGMKGIRYWNAGVTRSP